MEMYYIETEGWVTREWLLWNYIKSTDRVKEYEILNKAIIDKTEFINT